jgi:hypothetical protein
VSEGSHSSRNASIGRWLCNSLTPRSRAGETEADHAISSAALVMH